MSCTTYELLLRKFRDKNFRDPSEIHENHENIRPRKFAANGMLIERSLQLTLELIQKFLKQCIAT